MLNNTKKLVLMGSLLLAVAMGCKDDEIDTTNPTPLPDLKVSTALSGANMVPATTSKATGMVDGTVNQTTRILSLNITYADSASTDSTAADSVFTPTAWHIHKGAADTTGAVVFDLGTAFASPSTFKDTLTEAQLTDLKAGLYYVDIQTAKYPTGAIRGQLKAEE